MTEKGLSNIKAVKGQNDKVLHSTFTCHVCGERFLKSRARNLHEYGVHGYKDPFNLDVEGFIAGQHIDGSSLQYDIDRRIDKAEVLTKIAGSIQKNKDGTFNVISQFSPEMCYTVNLSKSACTCPDFVYRKVQCKHILAVKRSGV